MDQVDSELFEPGRAPWKFSIREKQKAMRCRAVHPELANWSVEAVMYAWTSYVASTKGAVWKALPTKRNDHFISFLVRGRRPAAGIAVPPKSVRATNKKPKVPPPNIPKVAAGEVVPFAEAREFARFLSLRSQTNWTTYCAGGYPNLPPLPEGIPFAPAKAHYYREHWVSWDDWLGTNKTGRFNVDSSGAR